MIKREVSRANHFLNYLITYFAIAFSGIPFFEENRVARLVFLSILILVFFFKKKIFDGKIILLAFAFSIIEIIQIFLWGGALFSIITSISFLIILPYLILKITGIKFLQYFYNILFVYALISLFFWTASNFLPGFHDFTYYLAGVLKPYTPHKITESFILYTYESAQEYGFYRNPGPFHEPGAFGVFLVLAIVINFNRTRSFVNKKNIVFFIAAITTFSTATYLSIIVLLILTNLFIVRKRRIILILLFPILVYLAFISYNNIDFLGSKISQQYDEQSEVSLTTPTSGRILGARKALVAISNYPIFGRGLISATQAEYSEPDAAGYGWITWISKIGLPLGILYMFYFYKTLKRYTLFYGRDKKFAIIAFISLLIVLAGQKHFSSIIFFMIFLIAYISKNSSVKKYYYPRLTAWTIE